MDIYLFIFFWGGGGGGGHYEIGLSLFFYWGGGGGGGHFYTYYGLLSSRYRMRITLGLKISNIFGYA